MIKKIKFTTLLLYLTLSNCNWLTATDSTFFSFSNIKIPPGTPTFQKGFKDGCESSSYARGNIFYRTKYKYKYDPKMIGNNEYRFGHSKGYGFCFQYMLSTVSGPQTSFDKFLLPYDYDTTFNATNINDAWDGLFNSSGGGPMGVSLSNPANGLNAIFDYQKSAGGTGRGALDSHPLWTSGNKGLFLFGWTHDGSYYGGD